MLKSPLLLIIRKKRVSGFQYCRFVVSEFASGDQVNVLTHTVEVKLSHEQLTSINKAKKRHSIQDQQELYGMNSKVDWNKSSDRGGFQGGGVVEQGQDGYSSLND
ncbi:hypothetical protein Golob_008116, partial [Gossypium lobatum]|nr:hypothetical protein [Gossypium lobatum]